MATVKITSLSTPGVEVFSALTDAQLRNRLDPDRAIFIAESPKVIRVALSVGLKPSAILCEERHISGDAADIIAACPEATVFTGSRELLAGLTGYTLTRGVLAAFPRPALPEPEALMAHARRIAVIDGVVDTTNIGAIFRSAAALGVDAVMLTPSSCDPLNRRAVRVSMGSVFLVPWTWLPDRPLSTVMHPFGFKTVALALRDDSVAIDDPVLSDRERLAMVLGTEGDGLSSSAIADADFVARIPMAHGVDSLNVAAASAVAFWELCKNK